MPITASVGQQAPFPTRDGGPQVASVNTSMSSATTITTGIDISTCNLLTFQCQKFGAVVSETLTLQISIDGGVNYRDFQTYTFAQLSVTNGVAFTVQVKGTHARLLLSNGQAAIGYNVKFYI